MSNVEFFAQQDSAVLEERSQNAADHFVGVLSQNEIATVDRLFNVSVERPSAVEVDQAIAGFVFACEVECALAARWEV